MMPRALARLFLAFLFVFAQCVSIAQASDLLMDMADNDNLDDISLEEVIPMDPFVGVSYADMRLLAATNTASESFDSFIDAVLHLFTDDTVELPSSALASLVEAREIGPPRLWLLHRVLLI